MLRSTNPARPHRDSRLGDRNSEYSDSYHCGSFKKSAALMTHATLTSTGRHAEDVSHEAAPDAPQGCYSFTQYRSNSFRDLVAVSGTTHSVMTRPPRPGPVPLPAAGAAGGPGSDPPKQLMDTESQRDASEDHEIQGIEHSEQDSAESIAGGRPKRATRTRKTYHYDSDDEEFDYPTRKKRGSAVAFEPPIEKKTKSAKKAYIRGKTCRTKGRFCRVCGNKDAIQWRRGPDGRLSLCNACGLRYRSFVKQEKHIPVNENPARIPISSLLQAGSPGPRPPPN